MRKKSCWFRSCTKRTKRSVVPWRPFSLKSFNWLCSCSSVSWTAPQSYSGAHPAQAAAREPPSPLFIRVSHVSRPAQAPGGCSLLCRKVRGLELPRSKQGWGVGAWGG